MKKISLYFVIRSLLLLPFLPLILFSDILIGEEGKLIKFFYHIKK